MWLGLAVVAGPATAAKPPASVSSQLADLAERAQRPAGWPALRRFAESAHDPEQRGLAFFALGYNQYKADQYEAALASLKAAAGVDFSLRDYAEYYAALAAQAAGAKGEIFDLLKGFSARHPSSALHDNVLALYASSLLDAGMPKFALDALTADQHVRRKPALALLLAKSYEQTAQPAESARVYQEIYYAAPLAPEAHAAGEAVERLRAELGSAFPAVSQEVQAARAEKLFQSGHYDEALEEFEELRAADPNGPLGPRWTIGRARCLIKLRRIDEALDSLQKPIPGNPAMDAERLATLVEGYAPRDDAESLKIVLEQLRTVYPQTLAYAAALDTAGDYFARKNDWATAATYYAPLPASFPRSEWAVEAHWRSAWAAFLSRDAAKAQKAFSDHIALFPDSPHVPAALYWLGRLAEQEGATAEARTFYTKLTGRYVQTYYAVQARARLKALGTQVTAGQSAPAAWAGAVTAVSALRPASPPAIDPCDPQPADPALDRFRILAALGLDDLASSSIQSALEDRPNDPALMLALSRFRLEKGNTAASLLEAVKAFDDFPEYDFSVLPQAVWQLLFPRDYWPLVRRQAVARGLDPYLVMGMIRQESAFNPRAISWANARGLMQVLPGTASRSRSGRRRAAQLLMNPDYNVRVGTTYLAGLNRRFSGNLAEVVAAYHAGEVNVTDWLTARDYRDPAEFLESIPIPSTRIYAERVLRDAEIYRRLLSSSVSFAPCHVAGQSARRTHPPARTVSHPRTRVASHRHRRVKRSASSSAQ